jgi:hypothetical protein
MLDPTTGPAAQPNTLNDAVVGAAKADPSTYLDREVPSPDDARAALVKRWQGRIQAAKKHWETDFKQMREDMDFLAGDQWPGEINKKNKYVANITQRHVQQKVAGLYSKNPKAVVRRRRTLDFAVWDEKPQTLMEAQMVMQNQMQTGMVNPALEPLMQDVIQGIQKRQTSDRIAKTMEVVFEYSLAEQQPPFKTQMKQLVRRVCACGVGFIKLGYHRVMEKRPEDVEKITDITEQMATLERLIADQHDGKITDLQAEMEQLRLLLQNVQNNPDVIVKEGLTFDFPLSNQIIVDPRCRNLRGFVGAQWVAQEYILDIDDIKEIYGKDITGAYRPYVNVNNSPTVQVAQEKDRERKMCCVWEIYSKSDGMIYVVAEGYGDFLKDPAEPEIKLERFWPYFPLSFNDVENDRKIYPPSDVALIRPMQKEYNRSRQALREHRVASRPKYATPDGMLDESDIEKLQTHPANAVIILKALQPGARVNDVLQPVGTVPIDPNLYDTELVFTDVQRVSGSQDANFGGTSNATATESSIAETSRTSSLQSNVDDLDDMLTELARASGQVLLLEMSPDTVKQIAGPGAVWPQLTANDVAQELFLEIEAGSSGRPNQAVELANFQKIAPTLLQIPGIDPLWLAKQAVTRLDDKLDVTDAVTDSMQSIVAMNAAKQPGTGNPMTDPNLQGSAGGQNAVPAPQSQAQTTHPAPHQANQPQTP